MDIDLFCFGSKKCFIEPNFGSLFDFISFKHRILPLLSKRNSIKNIIQHGGSPFDNKSFHHFRTLFFSSGHFKNFFYYFGKDLLKYKLIKRYCIFPIFIYTL